MPYYADGTPAEVGDLAAITLGDGNEFVGTVMKLEDEGKVRLSITLPPVWSEDGASVLRVPEVSLELVQCDRFTLAHRPKQGKDYGLARPLASLAVPELTVAD